MPGFLKWIFRNISYLGFGIYYHACEIIEYWRVVFRFYRFPRFALADLLIQFRYLFTNADKVCFNYLKIFSHRDVQRWYGETYLTTFAAICKAASVRQDDVLYELGCGRGRVVFWASEVLKIKATGIDLNPVFIQRANDIQRLSKSIRTEFLCKNLMDADLSAATVVYLYGTAFEEDAYPGLLKVLKTAVTGTRIITVSWPAEKLTDEPLFRVETKITGRYLWGEGDIYINIRT